MPPSEAGRSRVTPEVADISSDRQLLSFAAAGQVARLLRVRTDLSGGKIAQGAGFGANPASAGPRLTAAIREGPTIQELEKLDEIIGALAPEVAGQGGLCSLALRLSAERPDHVNHGLSAHVPPSWARKILKNRPGDDIGVLIQASTLLGAFRAADKMQTGGANVNGIRERYEVEIDRLARRLILISAEPPTSRNYDAQILLGSLASYAFDTMKRHLDRQVRYSPLGFQVWRSITKLVKLRGARNGHNEELQSWVRELVHDSEELRLNSLYAGRSLDLELAISVPAAWSPADDDWIGEALLKRATNRVATIRERGSAAHGLWERARREDRPGLDQTTKELRSLITQFREPDSRPDAAAGLRWVAATLEHAINNDVAVCNDWPDIDEPWFHQVQQAASELGSSLGIPPHLRPGARNLFQHMILQNAGVHRRQAIETVVASGWSEPFAVALARLLRYERNEAWLRIRALFALGFLQRPDAGVESCLVQACRHAYRNLKVPAPDVEPPRALRTEMHTALFAVGDCFGTADSDGQARTVRDALRPILIDLVTAEGPRAYILRRPLRAAAYLLIVTAQPRQGRAKDFSQELLEKLADHPDEVTAELSNWALRFRFADDGTVRPLLAAADI